VRRVGLGVADGTRLAFSWAELVRAATEQALEALRFAKRSSNAVAALTWIDAPRLS